MKVVFLGNKELDKKKNNDRHVDALIMSVPKVCSGTFQVSVSVLLSRLRGFTNHSPEA